MLFEKSILRKDDNSLTVNQMYLHVQINPNKQREGRKQAQTGTRVSKQTIKSGRAASNQLLMETFKSN